jgi:hypothetical protein
MVVRRRRTFDTTALSASEYCCACCACCCALSARADVLSAPYPEDTTRELLLLFGDRDRRSMGFRRSDVIPLRKL